MVIIVTLQVSSKERERKEHLEKMDRASKSIARVMRELRGSQSAVLDAEKDIEVSALLC